MITTEFAKPSERTIASPFCLIEQKGLLARLGEELSRAASELFHDPRGFFRDLVSPADTKDQKRRRLVYIGLGCALLAHSVLFAVMIIAGWHRVLASPKTEVPEYEITYPKFPPKSVDVAKDSTPKEAAPKGDLHQGGGGGGQHMETPPSQGVLPPMLPTPPIVRLNPSQIVNPEFTVAAGVQGPELTPPPPATTVGDPNGKPGPFSAGPGKGGGIGNTTGSGVGNGTDAGRGDGTRAGTGGRDAGTLEGKGTTIGSLYFNAPKPAGYVPFSWLYRPTPVVTPEAQANKSGGTVLLQATFRADGTITDIEIRNPVDYMTESAVESLKHSRFRPASVDGHPITMYRVLVRIEIQLDRHR